MARLPRANDGLAEELAGFLVDGRLQCPHCAQKATPEALYGSQARSVDAVSLIGGKVEKYPIFQLSVAICAACGGEAIFVRRWHYSNAVGDSYEQTVWHQQLYPVGRASKAFPNTPPHHFKAYQEACRTIKLSPAASACMSRRCLQGLLAEQGYPQKDLAKQVQALLGETDPKKSLPNDLHAAVDAIRGFGNFGAHPINDITTLQIIDVEEGEADWCIEIAEQLMEHYFERPERLKQRLAAANIKMRSGGKPSLKT